MAEFTNKQRRFIYYYVSVSSGNATDAARRAGYSTPDVQGPRLLRNVRIRQAVEAKVTEIALSADEVLSRLAKHATGNIGELVRVDKRNRVTFDFVKAEKRGKMHLIKKMKRGKEGWEVELYDAQAALALLGKYHNLFNDRPPVSEPGREYPDFLEVRKSTTGVNGNSNGNGHI